MYAVWENIYYKLKFDKNTSDTVNNMPSEKQIIIGNSNVLPSNEPERKGYKFLGWSKRANATSAQFRPGDHFLHDSYADVTLYAIWKEIVPVSIKIEAVEVKTVGGSMEGVELCVQDENNVWVPAGTSNEGNGENYNPTNLYLKATIAPADANINIKWTSSNTQLGKVNEGKVSFDKALGGKFNITVTDQNTGLSDSITVYVYNAQRKHDTQFVWTKPKEEGGKYIQDGNSLVNEGDKLILKTENTRSYNDSIGNYTWHKICYYYTTCSVKPIQNGYIMSYEHNRNRKYYTYGAYEWTPESSKLVD